MKVEVRPLPHAKWHGKTGKEDIARAKVIQALVDPRTNEYATGLSPQDVEYLKGRGVKYDLSPQFMVDTPHPFWDSSAAQVKLENYPIYFDTDIPLDFIRVKVMQASPFVANSITDYENGLYPNATHVIFDEKVEVESRAGQVETVKQCFIKGAKLSKERKAQIVLLVTGKVVRGKSDNFVEVALADAIEAKPSEVLRYVEADRDQVAMEALVSEALLRNVLQRQGHKIMYFDSHLGSDVNSVVEYLNKPENQELKIRIMSTLSE